MTRISLLGADVSTSTILSLVPALLCSIRRQNPWSCISARSICPSSCQEGRLRALHQPRRQLVSCSLYFNALHVYEHHTAQYSPPKSNPPGMPIIPPSSNLSPTPKSSPPGSPALSSSTKHDRPTFSRLLKFPISRAPVPTPVPIPPTLPPPSTRPTQPYPQTAYSPAAPSSSRRHPTPAPSPAQLSNPMTYMGDPTKVPSRSFWGTKR